MVKLIDFTLFELKFARSCKFPFKNPLPKSFGFFNEPPLGGLRGAKRPWGGCFLSQKTESRKQKVKFAMQCQKAVWKIYTVNRVLVVTKTHLFDLQFHANQKYHPPNSKRFGPGGWVTQGFPKSFVRPPHGKIEDFPRSPPKGGSLIEKRNFLGVGP